jgi:hypothetical protein
MEVELVQKVCAGFIAELSGLLAPETAGTVTSIEQIENHSFYGP